MSDDFYKEFRDAIACNSSVDDDDDEKAVPELGRGSGHDVVFTQQRTIIGIGRRGQDRSSGAQRRLELVDPAIELDHAYLAWDGRQLWVADAGSKTGTFVNRRLIKVARVRSGDLIQVGSYAWQLSVLAEPIAYLRRVGRIDGCRLQFRGFAVPNRLEPFDLDIEPGRFVAVIGPSGSGKSTLITGLLAAARPRTVFIDGNDVADDLARFRELLGYVSQRETLHGDLVVEDAVRFSGKLRNSDANAVEQDIIRFLDEADIRHRSRSKPCRRLSGGESKRVRVAAQLIGRPRLLILDEPGSGLDRDRERALMRTLRALSLRGCTVVIVTHGLHHLDDVDEVLLLADRRARFFGSPEGLRRAFGINRPDELDFGDPLHQERFRNGALAALAPVGSAEAARTRKPEKSWQQVVKSFMTQLALLVRREAALLAGGWLKRLLVPIVAMPMLFGMILTAVGHGSVDLFLFLTVLSTIWMGSSISLLSIADEWDIVEHESLLFLRPAAYVTAKAFTSTIIAWLQALTFCTVIAFCDRWGAPRAYEPTLSGLWPLFPTAAAATGLGLAVSAAVGGNRPLASFVLPLLMIGQIVFSAHIGRHQAEATVAEKRSVYDDFIIRRDEPTENGPTSLAVIGSFVTLSRYGDELLTLTAAEGRHDAWRYPCGRRACLVLSGATLILPALAWLLVRIHLARRVGGRRWRLKIPDGRLFVGTGSRGA